jgi:hypothetical protein
MRDTTAVIVLGMHRSGTSALTGVLRLLGVDLGSNLLDATEDNKKGYWEHGGIVKIHERLLSILDSSWSDLRPLPDSWWEDARIQKLRDELIDVIRREFSSVDVWGVKDPRVCRLIPLWLSVMDELGCRCRFLLIYRNPVEVARSLAKRNGFVNERSGLLWVQHILLAEKWTRNRPRIITSYDQLLGDLEGTVRRISEWIGDEFAGRVGQRMDDIRAFISPQLRHHVQQTPGWAKEFGVHSALVGDTWDALVHACPATAPDTEAVFDKLQKRSQTLTAAFDPGLTNHIGELQGQVRILQQELESLLSSNSWRLTRPMREVACVASHIAGGRHSK